MTKKRNVAAERMPQGSGIALSLAVMAPLWLAMFWLSGLIAP